MSKLEFSRRNNKKYNTISITIEKGLLVLKENYEILNPFPNKPWFLRVCSTSLLKTLR